MLDASDPSKSSQYAAVSFVLNDNYAPNSATQLVPTASVLVGYGPSEAQAAWMQACEQPVAAEYAARLAQPCGPAIPLCAAAGNLADRFVTINVPLRTASGGPLFDLGDSETLASVFVSLVVSAVDANGRPVSTTLSTSVSVVQGGVGTWCDAASAATTLEDVLETVDLLVGTAGSAADLARLQRVAGIQRQGAAGAHNVTQSVGSRSIESGLLTLAIRGKDSYFEQPGTAGFALELEDVVTLHVMGDSKMAAVAALLGSSTSSAFQVVADRVNRRSSLAPSPALAALCGAQAAPYPQASCVLRYDVRTRAAAATALEVRAAQPAPAAAFMRGIAGNSDYAAGLGANFSALIAGQYELNDTRKYRRAFWINPGFTWTGAGVAGADRFTLSQWLVLVALVDLNENATGGGGRRRGRTLLTATSAAGAPAATVQYGVDPAYLLALNLGLPVNQMSTWRVQLRLTAAQACLPPAALADAMLATMQSYFSAAGGGVEQVGLVSADVSPGSVACRRAGAGRRAVVDFTSGSSDATAVLYVIAAFRAGSFLDLSKFSQLPGVLSIQAVAVSAAAAAAAPGGGGPDPTAGSQDGSSRKLAITAGSAAAGSALAVAAVAVYLIWRTRRGSEAERAAAAAAVCAAAGRPECVVQCEMCFVGAEEWGEGRGAAAGEGKGGGGGGAGPPRAPWIVEAADAAAWPVYNGGGPAPRWITLDLDSDKPAAAAAAVKGHPYF